jgi:hypothetical protein
MANFFEAFAGMTKAQAKNAPDVWVLRIQAGGNGWFGVYGGDDSGNVLILKVYRGGAVVSDGAKAAVRVTKVLEDAPEWNRVYQATGLKDGDEIYAETNFGHRYLGPLKVKAISVAAPDPIEAWANRLKKEPGYTPTEAGLCPLAVPYLALGPGLKKLNEKLIGGPLLNVHGLAVHTTGMGGSRNALQTAYNGCVDTWNTNYANKGKDGIASAHFAISSTGDIVQIIPTTRIAWAQGNGDWNWISVEVDNDGRSPMGVAALEATKKLFGWVCSTYGVPRQLGYGTLFGNKSFPEHDGITTTVCQAAGSQTTPAVAIAILSRGLSCHYWLDARNRKPCPGVGMLRQLASVVKPGAVC